MLVVGSRHRSSWSLRAFLALAQTGAAHRVELVPLDRPSTAARLLHASPTGEVPVLRDGALLVWDSLAIVEHLAERFPGAGLWPEGRAARGVARSVAAEMHAGFRALRAEAPFDLAEPPAPRALSAAAGRDLARFVALVAETRTRFGAGGPFLFGAPSAADAMLAPVWLRVERYLLPVTDPAARAWGAAVSDLPGLATWRAAAARDRARTPVYRRVAPRDDAAMASVVLDVMTSFGAVGAGYSSSDPEVHALAAAYARPGHAYFVAELEGVVVGGAGLGPLTGGDAATCELRKMYLREEARGAGVGGDLLALAVAAARELGYRRMVVETLASMTAARRLYEAAGFAPSCREGATGHDGCDTFYAAELDALRA